jgi:SAM-dependent methyltransferase
MEFTGERFTPECVREIWYEHVHRYVFASGLVKGRKVLDAACGEGYGAALLASTAASVSAVDISEQAIGHAQRRYRAKNLEFQVADCLHLPYPDQSFDSIVSFETLEHLEGHDALLGEFRRVLAPGGFLLLSSPDKAVYTDRQNNQNPFHLRELYRDELESLLSSWFPAYRLWGQKLLFQSAIWSLEAQPGVAFHQQDSGELKSQTTPRHAATYLLALCAENEASLPAIDQGLSLFDDAAESVYEHYYHEIRKNMAAGELLAEKERELAAIRSQLEHAPGRLSWWRRLLGRS